MINNLLNEFKAILNESDWLDAKSKELAMEKVSFSSRLKLKLEYLNFLILKR